MVLLAADDQRPSDQLLNELIPGILVPTTTLLNEGGVIEDILDIHCFAEIP
jgi:hypothetical protein